MTAQVSIPKRQKNYPKKKRLMFAHLQEIVRQYDVVALSKITKVRATQLMTIRKKFRNDIKILIIKNKVAQRAFERVTDVQELRKYKQRIGGAVCVNVHQYQCIQIEFNFK